METFSVIIPTCARPLPLRRAVASVQVQSHTPLEIIVADDTPGGTPAAAPLDGPVPVRAVATAGGAGASAARNAGAVAARGEWLAFLDDDDEWLPGYLAAAAAHGAAADVICTDLLYRYDDGSERPGKRAPEALVVDAFLTRNPGLIGSNLIIRRALYAALGGFDETLRTAEDMDFGLRLSLHGGLRYAALRVPLVRHHQHARARLCTPRGAAMRAGIRRYYELHGWRMDAAQRAEFRAKVRHLWGIDEYGRDHESTP